MDLNPTDIVIHIINIFVLYILLRLVLYKPINKFLRARAQGIEKNLSDAEHARTEAEEYKASYEAHVQNAEKEAHEAALVTAQKADLSAAETIDAAKRDAEKILAETREQAQTERKESIDALKGQIADMSIELASEILGREVSEADNRGTIDAFFAEKARS